MKTIINLLLKISGAGWVWEKLDGKKTNISGIASILSGAAALIIEFLAIGGKHDFAAVITFIKGLPTNPSWMMILAGLAALGIGGKIQKNTDATEASATTGVASSDVKNDAPPVA